MGYRHYFYKVNKADVEKVKDMDLKEILAYSKETGVDIDEEDGYFYFNDDKFLNKKEVFEFGKLYWDDTAERIYNKGVHLFTKEEMQQEVCDYVPYVVGKDGVLEAIKIYEEKVINYYKGLLVDGRDYQLPLGISIHKEDVKSIDKVVQYIEDKIDMLSRCGLANTNEEHKWVLTDSWEYEHSIFNLVHILKSVDWETETILFYGW